MSGGESSSSSSGSGGASLLSSEDLSQPMQFKLDNIPRLTDGAGYRSWCSIAMLYLHSCSLWKMLMVQNPSLPILQISKNRKSTISLLSYSSHLWLTCPSHMSFQKHLQRGMPGKHSKIDSTVITLPLCTPLSNHSSPLCLWPTIL